MFISCTLDQSSTTRLNKTDLTDLKNYVNALDMQA